MQECPVCFKKISYASSLKVHMETHPDLIPPLVPSPLQLRLWRRDGPFKCLFWEKQFTINAKLQHHIMIHHTKERPYQCKTCNEMFSYKVAMKYHLVIKAVKQYLCHICGKGFNYKESLEDHQNAHKKETPHKCRICGLFLGNR